MDDEAARSRPASPADDMFLARRPEFGPKDGFVDDPDAWNRPQRQRAQAIAEAKAARKRNFWKKVIRADGMPESERTDRDVRRLGLAHDRLALAKAEQTLGSRDSRTLPKSSAFNPGDRRSVAQDTVASFMKGSTTAAEPIAEDIQGERAEDDRQWAQNMAAFRRQADARARAAFTAESRSAREARASKFSLFSPSTWEIFKNFGWAKRANAKRQIAELDEQLGGTALPLGPWKSGRYRAPKANDAALHTESAYSVTPAEERAWAKAWPAAERWDKAETGTEQSRAAGQIQDVAAAEGLDGSAFGKLVTGSTSKTAAEKAQEAESMERAIARSGIAPFVHNEGNVVSGHGILGAPTKDEEIPSIVRDVFGMDGPSNWRESDGTESMDPSQMDGSGSDDDDASADAPAQGPGAGGFAFRRLNTMRRSS